MFRFIKLIKSFFQKKKYTKEQKIIFENIIVGDVIYAKLPVSLEQEKIIEESHLHRPFLVVKKGKNEVYAFVFSSVKRKKLHTYDFYKQPFLFYNNSKPSYIYLNDLKKIPIQNIHKIIKHMDENTLMKLDKRLFISSNNGHSKPRFNMHLIPEKGDIVKNGEQLYLVVSRNDEKLIVNKVFLDFTDEQDISVIKNKGNTYLIKYKNDETLSVANGFTYVDIISLEELKKLRLKANKEKEHHNEYYFRFPIGYTFSLGMNDYLYLYHKGRNCYVINYDDETFYMDILKLKDYKYMKKGTRLDIEEVKYAMELLVENGKDIHGVINQILERM